MINSNGELKFNGFLTDDYEFISYINNVQVDYSVLLKRKNNHCGDLTDNYEVEKYVFTTRTLSKAYARDVATKEKYLFCNILNDGNKKYFHNEKYSVTDEYILVSYKEYYFKDFLSKLDSSIDSMAQIYQLWNQHIIESMLNTVRLENGERKTRTRS
ncbi:MAG: hypothetical protein IKX00_00265 [Bacilli bacterium]|nr:hypothetical protein [Bacilli bacterium]